MRAFVLFSALCLPVLISGQSSSPVPAASDRLNRNFAGNWAGQLEYKDYGTGERTFLPTWVETTIDPAGNAITFSYTYDDGPTKVVHERVTLSFAGSTATIASGTDPLQHYTVTGLDTFRKVYRGTMTLTGTSQDNGKAADVRITLTLRRNLYTWVKETRTAGTQDPFTFRDAYTFTRIAPPKG